MIEYDRQSWLPMLATVRGTVLPRVLLRVAFLTVLTGALVWLVRREYLHLDVQPLAHSLIGVALGLLLVFRTNASYDRYWEGRKQWGSIVNTTRNLVRAAASYAGPAEGLAARITAYALSLKQHLRGNKDLSELRPYLPEAEIAVLADSANPPTRVARSLSDWIARRVAGGGLDPALARALEQYVGMLLDQQGACERILRTPMPFAYVVHIRQLLVLYLISLPFVLVTLGWIAPAAVAFIAFGLLGIEEIGVEIEDPFGTDANDLPLETLCATIARDCRVLSGESAGSIEEGVT